MCFGSKEEICLDGELERQERERKKEEKESAREKNIRCMSNESHNDRHVAVSHHAMMAQQKTSGAAHTLSKKSSSARG